MKASMTAADFTVRFLYDKTIDEYACYNEYAEYCGRIYREGDQWAFTDAFVGETDLFDTADEAKAFVLNMRAQERERE